MGKDPNDPLKDSVLSTELLIERKILPDGTITENIRFDDPDVEKDKERLKAYEELQKEKGSPFKHSVRGEVDRASTAGSESSLSCGNSRLKLSALVAQYSAERINKGYWSPNTAAENKEA